MYTGSNMVFRARHVQGYRVFAALLPGPRLICTCRGTFPVAPKSRAKLRRKYESQNIHSIAINSTLYVYFINGPAF